MHQLFSAFSEKQKDMASTCLLSGVVLAKQTITPTLSITRAVLPAAFRNFTTREGVCVTGKTL
jgi:hypothetical protein